LICWCAYCQSYQGEIEPFDDFSMTHMICECCEAHDVIANESANERHSLIATYYGELRALVREGRIGDAIEKLDFAPSLGIHPADLMVGLLQPFIAWLAGFWVTAKFHPDYEHQVVEPLTLLLDRLASQYPELARYRGVERPTVLILSKTDVSELIGLKIIELGLAARAVSSKVVVEECDFETLRQQLLRYRPLVLGFTATTEEQLLHIEARVAELRRCSELSNLTILVGGLAVRLGVVSDPKLGMIHCRSVMDILRHVGSERDGRVAYSGVFLPVEPPSQRARAKSSAH
jgi:hypothetical protein